MTQLILMKSDKYIKNKLKLQKFYTMKKMVFRLGHLKI